MNSMWVHELDRKPKWVLVGRVGVNRTSVGGPKSVNGHSDHGVHSVTVSGLLKCRAFTRFIVESAGLDYRSCRLPSLQPMGDVPRGRDNPSDIEFPKS